MKFTPEVIAALQTLKDAAENDFERHRIAVLERDLTAPPVVEVIDDTHQKFDGISYYSNPDGHYIRSSKLHQVVYTYYNGEIPENYVIHHLNWDKEDNNISNLVAITKTEHSQIHKSALNIITHKTKRKICQTCGKIFLTVNADRLFCSHSCALKSSHKIRREKSKDEIRICKHCGKTFPKNNSVNGCFCSYACQCNYRRHKQKRTANSQILLFDENKN